MNISILGKYYFLAISFLFVVFVCMLACVTAGILSSSFLILFYASTWLLMLVVIIFSRLVYTKKSLFLGLKVIAFFVAIVVASFIVLYMPYLFLSFGLATLDEPAFTIGYVILTGVVTVIFSFISFWPLRAFGVSTGENVEGDITTTQETVLLQKKATRIALVIGCIVWFSIMIMSVLDKKSSETNQILVSTYHAKGITHSDAVLVGSYWHVSKPTYLYFEYGMTSDLLGANVMTSKFLLVPDVHAPDIITTYSESLINKLVCGTVYYYRFNAEPQPLEENKDNSEHPVINGDIDSFSTLPCGEPKNVSLKGVSL